MTTCFENLINAQCYPNQTEALRYVIKIIFVALKMFKVK